MMKARLSLGIALLFALNCAMQAADTAYSALRVVGKRDGQEVLNRVLELRGRGGSPNPDVWKVIVDEPRARGGVRELEVQRGKIIGERTPTSRAPSRPMNFNQLNLDSEGAFQIANQEAGKVRLPFDRVDYHLKSGTNGGAPVWDLELLDSRDGRLGSLTIAADSGTVLSRNFDRPRAGQDDREYLDDRRNPDPRYADRDRGPDYDRDRNYDRDRDRDGNYEDDRRREGPGGLPGFLNRVGRHFQKRGVQIENFVTGK